MMLTVSTVANASTIWHEGDDGQGGAGGLPASANITTGVGPLTDIIGGLSNETSGADMYEIYIYDPVTFSATTTGHGNDPIVNPAIYLFDASGDGLFGNDNISGGNSQAAIPAGTTSLLSAGLYYILITPSGNLPANKNGDEIFGDLTNTTMVAAGSSTPLKIKNPYDSSGTTADPVNSGVGYDIELTGADFAQAPEPATLAVTALGLAALALRSRRVSR